MLLLWVAIARFLQKGVRDTTPALQGLRCDSMAVRAGAHAQGAQLILRASVAGASTMWTSTVSSPLDLARYTGGRGTRKLHTPVRYNGRM